MSKNSKGAFDAFPALARQVALKRVLARLVLFLERAAPHLLKIFCVGALFTAIAWFGGFRILPDLLRWALLAVFGFCFLATLLPLARVRWPVAEDADRLLEARNNLDHQPVAVQEHRLSYDNPFARALWKEHQIRMVNRIKTLDAGLPRPNITRHDPFALRAIPVLLLAVAFGFSFSNGAGRLSDAFRPQATPPGAIHPDLRIDAWLTPPAYTGRAPVFLTGRDAEITDAVKVPQNSELTVRITGSHEEDVVVFSPVSGTEEITLVTEGTSEPEKVARTQPVQRLNQSPASRTYLLKIAESGELEVNGEHWSFEVILDHPPEISFQEQPQTALNGALEINFTGKDDYGIIDAQAVIEPVDQLDPAAKPLYPLPEYKLDIPRRNAHEIKAVTSRDLTEHPLAGKRVRIVLVATDGAGQEGHSPSFEIVLPTRPFSEPLAAAVAEQRQVFSLDTRQIPYAIELNEALAVRPDETIANLSHFLLIRSALGRMKLARGEEQLKETADYLWEIALGMDDGDLSAAERRLRDAQNALKDALENDADDEEIARLMDELRQAMQEFMSELAERMQNSPRMQQSMHADNMIRQRDLQNMLDQIENLARSGNRESARQMLSELQRMMNNLQAGRMPQSQQGQQQNSQMRQQIDKLGEIMQEQQQLMDQTFQLDQALRDRMQRGEQPYAQDQQDPPQSGQQRSPADQMTAEQLREALKNLRAQQDRLGEKLEELQQGLKDLGMQAGEGFGRAQREMENAGEALGQGEGKEAVQGQGNALEALRQGAQNMMQQMMQAMQQGQGNGNGVGQLSQGDQNGRDPLGRPRANTGPDFGNQVKVPDEIDVQRAREILEAIRERLGNALSRETERLYLERLLEIR